jgi:hypothetical protein
MVFARTKLMIHDELFKPRPVVRIHFSGAHPEKLYHEIPNLVTKAFKVSEHAMMEKKFSWLKGEPERFKILWEIDKDLDRFSYYWMEIELSGTVSKGSGTGEVVVVSALRTEYPQDTFWERSLFYEFMRMIWHNAFYARKREEWLVEGRRLVSLLVDNIKQITKEI